MPLSRGLLAHSRAALQTYKLHWGGISGGLEGERESCVYRCLQEVCVGGVGCAAIYPQAGRRLAYACLCAGKEAGACDMDAPLRTARFALGRRHASRAPPLFHHPPPSHFGSCQRRWRCVKSSWPSCAPAGPSPWTMAACTSACTPSSSGSPTRMHRCQGRGAWQNTAEQGGAGQAGQGCPWHDMDARLVPGCRRGSLLPSSYFWLRRRWN